MRPASRRHNLLGGGIFEQSIGGEQESSADHWVPERDWPRAAGTDERLSPLVARQIEEGAILRYQPDAGITHARPEKPVRSHHGERAGRFAGYRIFGNGCIHATEQLRARRIGASINTSIHTYSLLQSCRYTSMRSM